MCDIKNKCEKGKGLHAFPRPKIDALSILCASYNSKTEECEDASRVCDFNSTPLHGGAMSDTVDNTDDND